jgi:hypothetical protein
LQLLSSDFQGKIGGKITISGGGTDPNQLPTLAETIISSPLISLSAQNSQKSPLVLRFFFQTCRAPPSLRMFLLSIPAPFFIDELHSFLPSLATTFQLI